MTIAPDTPKPSLLGFTVPIMALSGALDHFGHFRPLRVQDLDHGFTLARRRLGVE